ncbi:MAG TPA: DNA-binding response regulator [Sphingobacteriaceae bacterium]|nr:DNA-binding response regulator [Sphingobacteriaceae bacterium]
MKLLVVEDEKALLSNIISYLSEEGNVCDSCTDLVGASGKLSAENYDCILLDIGLPDGEGFEVLEYLQLHKRNEAVIIISARNSLDDRINGLNIGADDYLTKPFHLAELKARVEAVYRRKMANGSQKVVFNEITIDIQSRNVEVDGTQIILTRKEYDMLIYFIANKGKIISKTAIAEHLWGDEMNMYDNLDFIYTHIKNLRKKILDATSNDYLKSIYGIGYKFMA